MNNHSGRGAIGTSVTATLAAALVAAVLAGCTVGPDYQEPRPDMPAGWTVPIATTNPAIGAATRTSAATTQPVDVARWWTVFKDPMLSGLIERAMESNLDLRQAEARLRQARANRGVVKADRLPGADVSGSYRRSAGSGGDAHDVYQAGFDAAWEIDVFGGVRRNIEAADADLLAGIEDRRDVMVSMTAEVARNYIELRGFQQELSVTRRNLETQNQNLELTRARVRAGFNSALDVASAEALVANTQSQIPLLEGSIRQTIYALGVLLGRPPGALVDELTSEAAIPAAPPLVPVGLPSDLLLRRPDIRRAEAQIHAASARVGVATADLFPRFSLTGGLGTSANSLGGLTNWGNRFWSVGPGVSWTIFDAGRINWNIEARKAIEEQALLAYQQTVLTALADVETSLVGYAQEQRRRISLAQSVTANRRAVNLATELYRQGQTDFLNVLTAQRTLLAAEDALAQSDRTIATNLVALYKALGGGWETGDGK